MFIMVHTFEACGTYMALDTDSGAVHAVDKLAYEIIRQFESKSKEEIVASLQGEFGASAVQEAYEEVEEVAREGMLFTHEDYDGVFESAQPGVVKAMCLHVAHDCNLRCAYCFASTGEFHGERMLMDAQVGFKALDFLVAHSGNRHFLEVDFFGGEPLMNWEAVKQIVAYGRSLEAPNGKRFKFTITTNGLGLNDEVIDFVNREMDNVVISLDGRPEVHDLLRKTVKGTGSFEHILPKAKRLAESRNQDKYYVRGTFTRHNLDFASDVLYLADQGFEQISIEPVVAPDEVEYSLHREHLPEIIDEYEKLASLYLRRRRDGQWFNFFHFMIDLGQGPCVKKRLTGCGAGNEYVAVAPQGDIYPCHQFVGMPEFKMGSVLDGSFDRDLQAKFAANHVLAKPECKDCWARFYCSGGCAANAHQFNGDIAKPYELGCEMERKRLECALAIYAIERDWAQQQGE